MMMLVAGQSRAAAQAIDVDAWIEIQGTGDSLLSFVAFARNLSGLPATYVYSLDLTRESDSQGNKSRNSQSGSVDLLAEEVRSLAKIDLALPTQGSLQAVLELSDGKAILAADRLSAKLDSLVLAKADESLVLRKVTDEDTVEEDDAEEPTAQVETEAVSPDELEIDGIIIDETRSKAARDFYALFYRKWQAPAEAKGYSITLKEFPSRVRIARVGIEVNGRLVYQPVLQLRQEILERLSDQAVGIVSDYLQDQSQLGEQMENEDQAGSGLF